MDEVTSGAPDLNALEERCVWKIGVGLARLCKQRNPFLVIWALCMNMTAQRSGSERTSQGVGDEDQETLHRVYSLQLLEQRQIEQRICASF